MKYLLASLLFFASLSAFSQVRYHEGYFINNEGQRTNCLILDKDWGNNPEKFKYKLTSDDSDSETGLENVTEFGLSGLKYIRAKVSSEMSSLDLNYLTYNRQPEFQERTLFLKVVEEGPAVLYNYKATGIDKFFFSVNGGAIEQLVFTMYKVDLKDGSGPQAASNKMYLNQLQRKMNCGNNVTGAAFSKMNYKTDPLKKFFAAYNKCSGYVKPTEEKVRGKSKINIKVAPGVDFASLGLTRISSGKEVKSDAQTNFRFGAEFEVVLPFNQNKWSFTVEPTYQKFSSEGPIDIEYSSLEFPINLRHYFFLSTQARIFLNAGAVIDFPMGEKILNDEFDVAGNVNAAVGAGFQFGNLSLEYRFYTPRDIIRSYTSYKTDYSKSSIIVGYTFRLSKD